MHTNMFRHSQVLEYLSKKGYSKTEATLRRESAFHDSDGRPIHRRAEDTGVKRFTKGYSTILAHVLYLVHSNCDRSPTHLRR
jgi:hypothetical protein